MKVCTEKFSLCFSFLTVGYACLPLMKDDQIASQEYNIPVATSLPPNYLSFQDSANGKVLGSIQLKRKDTWAK